MLGTLWSEDEKAIVRQLWATDLPAAGIAAQLPGRTRNMVIQVAHRLGLPMRPSPIRRQSDGAAPDVLAAPPASWPRRGMAASPPTRRDISSVGPVPHTPSCQWPLWPNGVRPGMYAPKCGAPTVVVSRGKAVWRTSYCAEHARRAFQCIVVVGDGRAVAA